MLRFGKKAPEIQRVDAAREAILKQSEPRPVVLHTVNKVRAAIEQALTDRDRVADSLASFDEQRIAGELKTALRTKAHPTDPDTSHIMSLRRRHEAVHALHNRRDAITKGIERSLADLETFVAERAMTTMRSDDVFADLDHWIDTLDADARSLAASHDALDRISEA